jgi:hypothetical protein
VIGDALAGLGVHLHVLSENSSHRDLP